MDFSFSKHSRSNEHGRTVNFAGNHDPKTEEDTESTDIGDPFKPRDVSSLHDALSRIHFISDGKLVGVQVG